MSCCSSCHSGLGALAKAYGLRGLGDVLPAGAHFRQGFWLRPNASADTYAVAAEIQARLNATGQFRNLRVTLAAGVINLYYLVEGDTAVDFDTSEDLTNLILEILINEVSTIGSVGQIENYDTLQIDSIPQSQVNKPGVQQPTTGPGSVNQPSAKCQPGYYDAGWWSGCQPITSNSNNSQSCKWSDLSFGNYAACILGIRDPITGVLAGTTGAILGVAVIAAVGLVLLKR
jgi:hypothetical protein